jgi:hypothetical protein
MPIFRNLARPVQNLGCQEGCKRLFFTVMLADKASNFSLDYEANVTL